MRFERTGEWRVPECGEWYEDQSLGHRPCCRDKEQHGIPERWILRPMPDEPAAKKLADHYFDDSTGFVWCGECGAEAAAHPMKPTGNVVAAKPDPAPKGWTYRKVEHEIIALRNEQNWSKAVERFCALIGIAVPENDSPLLREKPDPAPLPTVDECAYSVMGYETCWCSPYQLACKAIRRRDAQHAARAISEFDDTLTDLQRLSLSARKAVDVNRLAWRIWNEPQPTGNAPRDWVKRVAAIIREHLGAGSGEKE